MISKAAIIGALERRYDYASARTIFNEVNTAASLDASDGYSPVELDKFTESLKDAGDRLDAVIAALGELKADGGGKAAAKPAAKAETKAEAKPAAKAAEKKKAPAKKAAAKKKAPAKKKKK